MNLNESFPQAGNNGTSVWGKILLTVLVGKTARLQGLQIAVIDHPKRLVRVVKEFLVHSHEDSLDAFRFLFSFYFSFCPPR